MLKIGLTGGIGSGKSTISEYIRELGFKIVDADVVSRDVLELYPEILAAIRDQFGIEFFDDNNLSRKKLGTYLFQNKEKLKEYEEIIIPYIKKEIYKRIEEIEKAGEAVCFLDAPTLIENGIHKEMDKNILIWADRNIQIQRIIERDNMSLEDVDNRINAQMSLEDKKQFVDFVVNNSGEIEDTKKEIYKIIYNLGLLKGRCICPKI